MALNDDRDHRVEISAEEFASLQNMLKDGNRLGMYLRLHELSGSQTALDMAQICSSSGLRGGTAWALNEAYGKLVPGYPKEGVEFFSKAIAKGDLDLIQLAHDKDGNGRYLIPTDLQMYEGALDTWNNIGKAQEPPNPNLGNHYFPGLPILAEHYTEQALATGKMGPLVKHIQQTESWGPALGGAGAMALEAFMELVADNTNRSETINDLLDQRPDLRPRSLKSPTGDDVVVFDNAQGKPEHVIRLSAGRNLLVDQPIGFAEKVMDGLRKVSPFEELNKLGSDAASQIPTPSEIRSAVAEVLQPIQKALSAAARAQDGNRGERGGVTNDETQEAPQQQKLSQPKQPSFLDSLIDRLSQGAVDRDDRAMNAAVGDYLRHPSGQQFQVEVAQQRQGMEAQERQTLADAHLASQQQDAMQNPHVMRR